MSGGVSVGRERINSCNLVDDLSLVSNPVLAREPAVPAASRAANAAYCDVQPPFQPQVRARWPIRCRGASARRDSSRACRGRRSTPQYPLTNAIARPRSAATSRTCAPTVDMRRAGHALRRPHLPDRRAVHARPFKVGATTDPSDGVGLQPVQCEPDEHEPGLHRTLRLGVAGPDRDSDAAVHRLRRADRLLKGGGRWLGDQWSGIDGH